MKRSSVKKPGRSHLYHYLNNMKISEFYNQRYNPLVFWSSLAEWQQFTLKDLQQENLQGKKVMEIGVWPNGLLFQLHGIKDGNIELFGVDLDNHILEHLTTLGINNFQIDISSEELPVLDNTIDIIIFNEVIEHVFDCQHALDEIFRVLKKGGQLYISTHNSFNIFMRLKYLFGYIPTPSLDVSHETMGEHIRLFNQDLLVKLLVTAGFHKSNIQNRSWFQLKGISFYTGYLTGLLSRHLYFIVTK